jgi:hypothetical protein
MAWFWWIMSAVAILGLWSLMDLIGGAMVRDRDEWDD